jgi:non-ribosomal peptide synthetase component F
VDNQTLLTIKLMQNKSAANGPRNPVSPAEYAWFAKSDIEQSIPARFERQVKLYPDRVAISDSGRIFSYRKLNEESNKIAHIIIEACGDAEEPVAFLLDQGASGREDLRRSGSFPALLGTRSRHL